MPIDTEDNGFLSRWSRRKVLVRQGATPGDLAQPPATAAPELPAAKPTTLPVSAPLQPGALPVEDLSAPESRSEARPAGSTPAAVPQPPPPTLADVAALTHDSDYSRFVGRSVQPEVKNAALAKLFTDPHFNVMDRLDTYIDDYGKPDPLPAGMLRQMLQAHVLGLFDEEDAQEKAALALAQSAPPAGAAAPLGSAAAPPTEPCTDENTDLQLQPDHALGCASPEPSPGQDPRGELRRAGDGPQPAVPA